MSLKKTNEVKLLDEINKLKEENKKLKDRLNEEIDDCIDLMIEKWKTQTLLDKELGRLNTTKILIWILLATQILYLF